MPPEGGICSHKLLRDTRYDDRGYEQRVWSRVLV